MSQPPVPSSGWLSADEPEVGAFRQGSELSRWALARYLVGRAVGRSVGDALLLVAVAVLALAVLVGWSTGAAGWAVLVGAVALVVLGMRAVLLWLLRALTAIRGAHPAQVRMRALVSDTRGDVLRELRRIGLPGRTWTLPLLALRLARRRRRDETLARLRGFEVERAVPAARLDELHLLLRTGSGRS